MAPSYESMRPISVTHEISVTWGDDAFDGDVTTLRLTYVGTSPAIVGLVDSAYGIAIRNVPIAVLRRIVELAEAMGPKFVKA